MYFAYIRDVVGPFLVLVWTSLKDFVVTSEEVTRPHRAWVVEKAVECYHWVSAFIKVIREFTDMSVFLLLSTNTSFTTMLHVNVSSGITFF